MAKEFVEFNVGMSGNAHAIDKVDWLKWAMDATHRLVDSETASGVVHNITQAVIAHEMLLANGEGIAFSADTPLENYRPRVKRPRRETLTHSLGGELYSGQLYFYRYLQASRGEIELRTLSIKDIFGDNRVYKLATKMRLEEAGWSKDELNAAPNAFIPHAAFRLETPEGTYQGADIQTEIVPGSPWDVFKYSAALALGTTLSRFY